MAKQCGIDVLLYAEDPTTPGTYLLVGGMQTNGFSINKETVDVTDKGAVGWRELLDCGIKSASISGDGVFDTASAPLIAIFTRLFNAAAIHNYRIVFGNAGTPEQIQGPFATASFERTGAYNEAETFTLSLESAGVLIHTPSIP